MNKLLSLSLFVVSICLLNSCQSSSEKKTDKVADKKEQSIDSAKDSKITKPDSVPPSPPYEEPDSANDYHGYGSYPFDAVQNENLVGLQINICFQSKKLNLLIEQMKTDTNIAIYFSDSWVGPGPYLLKNKYYAKLSVREKFLFALQYPEDNTQSCNSYPQRNETGNIVYAHFIPNGTGKLPSERQMQSLIDNRDSSIKFINECLVQSNDVNEEMLRLILVLSAKECIPLLISDYKKNETLKDFNILTTLLLLMKKENYYSFVNSDLYQLLYVKNKGYMSHLHLSEQNEKEILDFANNFYSEK